MNRMCQSQPNPQPITQYHWIVSFDWSLDNPLPFSMDVREHFGGCIPESWFKNKWRSQHRTQKTNMRIFPNRTMSVFCKVEKGKLSHINYLITYVHIHILIDSLGTPKKRRENLLKLLNREYVQFILTESQATAYEQLVETKSYRLLDGFTYEHRPQPFRSRRCVEAPETEVIIIILKIKV